MAVDWQPLIDIVNAHQRFAITSHVRPDADAIGSEMGLAGILESLGKTVRIINPSATPDHLKFLDPTGRIGKVGTEVPVAMACENDVHFIVDTSAWQQLNDIRKVLEATPAKKVIVDHHISADDLGAVEFKDSTASATGVLITEFAEALGARLSIEQATALFCAIATDTGWFRFPNADARTYRTAARLIELGVEPHLLYRELYERSSLARLKLQSVVLGRVELACGDRIGHTWVTRKDFKETGAQPADTEDLVNYCLTVSGVQGAFILVEQIDGRMKASLRSRTTLDVASIAEQFGGGGHRQASGAMLHGPMDPARERLLRAFEAGLPELQAPPS